MVIYHIAVGKRHICSPVRVSKALHLVWVYKGVRTHPLRISAIAGTMIGLNVYLIFLRSTVMQLPLGFRLCANYFYSVYTASGLYATALALSSHACHYNRSRLAGSL